MHADCRVSIYSNLTRRINTEEKAKVVAAVWGTEFIQCLAALAILPRTILKNRIHSSFSSYHPSAINPILYIVTVLVQNSMCGKELNKFCPSNNSNNLCLFFCIYPSSMLGMKLDECMWLC